MRRICEILALLSLCACTQSDVISDTNMFTGVDPLIQPYFNAFTGFTGVSTSGITAGFVSLNVFAGECVMNGPYREVRIDPSVWGTATAYQKQQLISHELGHCALYLSHNNTCSDGTDLPDGQYSTCNLGNTQPLSIMNWVMFNYNQAYILATDPGPYYQALVQGNRNAVSY